jgi:hypothetical protein
VTTLGLQRRRAPADLHAEALIKEARRLRRRRWSLGLGIVVVLVLAVGLPLGLGVSTSSPSPRIVGKAVRPIPTVNAASFAGQGELAFVSRGALWELDGRTSVLREVAARNAFEPVLSPDGRWLAYLTYSPQTLTPVLGLPASQLWIANGNGTDPRAVRGLSKVDRLSWSPASDTLAVADLGPNNEQPVGVVLVEPAGSWHLVVGTAGATTFVWSPSGTALAFSGELADGKLGTVSMTGGKPTVWQSEHNDPAYPLSFNPTAPALWLPKGEGLLYWIDQDNSASVEADGLTIYLLRRSGGRPKPLATTLLSSSIAVSATGALAITAGGNRQQEVTKGVEICDVATALCKRVPTRAGDVSFDPSWTSDGRDLIYAVGPSNDDITMYQPLLAHWYGALTEWDLNLSKSSARELSGSRGASYSRSSGHGSSLLSVSSDGLILRRSPTSPATLVASPFFPPNDWPTFYGQIDWADQFAWSPST